LSNMAMLTFQKRVSRRGITVHGFRSTFRDWVAECTEYPASRWRQRARKECVDGFGYTASPSCIAAVRACVKATIRVGFYHLYFLAISAQSCASKIVCDDHRHQFPESHKAYWRIL
jgi:hypothetical protein